MKKLFLLGITLFLSSLALSAPSSDLKTKTIHTQVQSSQYCENQTQFFKFNNLFENSKQAFYLESENYDVDSTFKPPMKFYPLIFPTGDSEIYKNNFTSNKSIITGATHVVTHLPDGAAQIETLCSVTFSCACEEEKCSKYITLNGSRCEFAENGSGTETDPYVILMR